jgi:hypothetical protein
MLIAARRARQEELAKGAQPGKKALTVYATNEQIAYRRACVRNLHRMGLQPAEIMKVLLDDETIPEHYRQPLHVVINDLKAIKKQDELAVETGTYAGNLAVYVGRLEAIYKRALKKHQYYAALEAAKLVAQANGLTTKEPLQVHHQHSRREQSFDLMERVSKLPKDQREEALKLLSALYDAGKNVIDVTPTSEGDAGTE